MNDSNHPRDELLSAFASGDEDVAADAELASHVAACRRCADLVNELGTLRVSLAALPDVAPPRPLRLLPPVDEPSPAPGIGTWVRRLFAPVMTAGAALALVGVVGTTAPILEGMAGGAADAGFEALDGGAEQQAAEGAGDGDAGGAPAEEEPGVSAAAAPELGEANPDAAGGDGDGRITGEDDRSASDGDEVVEVETYRELPLPAERSVWPMLLFTGIALMIGIALLRWILAPRAG